MLLMVIPSVAGFTIDQPSVSGHSGEFLDKSITSRIVQNDSFNPKPTSREQEKRDWVERSVAYYSKVMREDRRRQLGQAPSTLDAEQEARYAELAMKHYFALTKIRNGKFDHAEKIYRRTIDEIIREGEEDAGCNHAQLAVTTLLLALHTQRSGDIKKTRSVFVNFFRISVVENEISECACSAKVLQAFALFEMKNGLPIKSLEIAKKAIELDGSLATLLQWKQFREAIERERKFKMRR